MSDEVAEATDALMKFMDEHVYHSPLLEAERDKVRGVVQRLFELYMEDDDAFREAIGEVPEDTKQRARAVCDYVAGMTDRFAREQFMRHFVPSGFPSFER